MRKSRYWRDQKRRKYKICRRKKKIQEHVGKNNRLEKKEKKS